MSVIIDSAAKDYSYLSRYSDFNVLYNSEDGKKYYETTSQLRSDFSIFESHLVEVGDSLDSIALRYYGNPLYWWIIADVNRIQDIFNLKVGTRLSIPYLNQISY